MRDNALASGAYRMEDMWESQQASMREGKVLGEYLEQRYNQEPVECCIINTYMLPLGWDVQDTVLMVHQWGWGGRRLQNSSLLGQGQSLVWLYIHITNKMLTQSKESSTNAWRIKECPDLYINKMLKGPKLKMVGKLCLSQSMQAWNILELGSFITWAAVHQEINMADTNDALVRE